MTFAAFFTPMRAGRVVVTNLGAVARRRARAQQHTVARASSSTSSLSSEISNYDAMEVLRFPALSDNYGFAIRCARTNAVALVDAPEEDAITRALEDAKWPAPSAMLNTHWHGDHVGANEGLRKRFPGMAVHAPKAEVGKIRGRVDVEVGEGDVVRVGDLECEVRETPGHTLGHVVYHFKTQERVFVGDTLFALGCGRLFEGTPAQMWSSISKILAMPDATEVYCAHEYTLANAKFALSVDPTNEDLQKRAREIEAMRADGKPTVPTTVGLEKLTNPFCRPDSVGVQRGVDMEGSKDLAAVFGAVRAAKDNF
jgi:hydroxyacylglutathione hydrolase